MTEFEQKLNQAVEHLKADDVLRAIIERSEPCALRPHTNYFQALAGSIIGQQLSVKAAATIRERFAALGGNEFPSPEQVAAFGRDELRGVGLSNAKVNYVQDLAQHVLDGRLEINALPSLTNEQIIVEVTDVKGIGEWTAHMFLMFCLGRLDVLPTGDLGIRKGMQMLYELPEMPTPVEMMAVAERHKWTGYESVASWYVWRALDMAVII